MSLSLLRHCTTRSIPQCSRRLATAAFIQATSSEPHSTKTDTAQQHPSHSTEVETTAQYPSHSTLPPAKMRALISLYHQSETFISLDNLSEAIDTAFIEKPKDRKARERTYENICTKLRARHRQPKVSGGRTRSTAHNTEDPTAATARMWSEQEHEREYQVRAALFGTEGMGKPGLGVLEDEYERVMENLRSDRRAEQDARGPQ